MWKKSFALLLFAGVLFVVWNTAGAGTLDRTAGPVDLDRPSIPATGTLHDLQLVGGDRLAGWVGQGESSLAYRGWQIGEVGGVVRFWDANGRKVLESQVLDHESGQVLLGGLPYTLKGVLTEVERLELERFAESALAPVVAEALLAYGCHVESDQSVPVLTAFAQPVQLVQKYTGKTLITPQLLASAPCSYEGSEHGGILAVDRAMRMPRAYGYFALDRQGLVSPEGVPDDPPAGPVDNVAGAQSPHIGQFRPCGAECWGVCGPDCDDFACIDWGSCQSGCREIKCGSHAGCRAHDTCYDQCNMIHGCGGFGRFACMRDCDAQCLVIYGSLWCSAWALGTGPFDQFMFYEEPCSTGGGGGGGGFGDDGGGGGGGGGGDCWDVYIDDVYQGECCGSVDECVNQYL